MQTNIVEASDDAENGNRHGGAGINEQARLQPVQGKDTKGYQGADNRLGASQNSVATA